MDYQHDLFEEKEVEKRLMKFLGFYLENLHISKDSIKIIAKRHGSVDLLLAVPLHAVTALLQLAFTETGLRNLLRLKVTQIAPIGQLFCVSINGRSSKLVPISSEQALDQGK